MNDLFPAFSTFLVPATKLGHLAFMRLSEDKKHVSLSLPSLLERTFTRSGSVIAYDAAGDEDTIPENTPAWSYKAQGDGPKFLWLRGAAGSAGEDEVQDLDSAFFPSPNVGRALVSLAVSGSNSTVQDILNFDGKFTFRATSSGLELHDLVNATTVLTLPSDDVSRRLLVAFDSSGLSVWFSGSQVYTNTGDFRVTQCTEFRPRQLSLKLDLFALSAELGNASDNNQFTLI